MSRIICPKCDATLAEGEAFEAHMSEQHPGVPASLGFGHTMFR